MRLQLPHNEQKPPPQEAFLVYIEDYPLQKVEFSPGEPKLARSNHRFSENNIVCSENIFAKPQKNYT
ncbi:MAG: hypothetical protein EAZ89_18500 [Bacteroidetes bacterium]|nr:MAG: hypothetical protein EAZ89_18500 [Bacteroidota bacterium]